MRLDLLSIFNYPVRRLIYIALLPFIFSCNVNKKARPADIYLLKNTVNIDKVNKRRFIESELENVIKQKPNKKFIGTFPVSFYAYRWGSKGKDNRFKRFLRYTIGEPPVEIDSSIVESSIKSMQYVLRGKGFYYPEIKYTVEKKKLFPFGWLFKNARVVNFQVKMNERYRIGRIDLNIAEIKLFQLVRATMDESYLRRGQDLDREDLTNEQNRLTEMIRNNGYFAFSKDFIEFDVDTNAGGSYWISVGINIKNRTDYEVHQQFIINHITVEVDKNTSDFQRSMMDTMQLKNFTYVPNNNHLSPAILERMIFLEKGAMFQQQNVSTTQSRLTELQLFRFISILPSAYIENDTGKIDYYIKLTPLKKYDLTLEPQAITSDQSNTFRTSSRNYGLAAIVQLTDRNIFHNAELLQLRFRSSFEAQRGGSIPTNPFFNSNEQSLTLNFIFPRLIFLGHVDRRLRNATSKTILSASAIYEQNVDYSRRVFTLGYVYQVNRKNWSYYVSPAEVSYIRTTFESKDLETRNQNDIFLQTIFANNLVTSSRLGFTYTNKNDKNKSFVFLRWDLLEFGGNTIQLFNTLLGAPKNSAGKYEIFGVNYFQYYKSFIDLRYNFFADWNNSIVYRVATGVAVPYGNSPGFVPFEKRFFTGGANSIRAFRPRSIGPGTYDVPGQLDRSGEVRIELNVEYRFNIYRHLFEGALFTDAGNVWTLLDDGRDGAKFNLNTFYNELGIGSGLGLRLNLNIFIFRFDAAFPLHDPREIKGKRWVIKDIDGIGWLYDNSVLNFGVGYPF